MRRVMKTPGLPMQTGWPIWLILTCLPLSAAASSTCSYPVNTIQTLIQEKKISKAYQQAKEAYSFCPDREHGELYARLAWWNHRPYEAFGLIRHIPKDSPLYRNIYGAKILADIRRGRHPKIPSFLQNHYDILIARINQALKENRPEEAYRLATRLHSRYPNRESRELQALSLMAMKRYRESLEIYRTLGNLQKVRQLESLIIEEKLKKSNDAITLAWQDGNRPLAKKIYDSLNTEEQKLFSKKYPINNCRVHSLHMAGIGTEWIHHDDHRYRDRSFYVEGTFPVDRYTIYAKAQHTQRYGAEDQKFSLEIYPPGSDGVWGYLSLSLSDSGGFFSDYSVGGYLYRQFGSYEVGVGYLYSHYAHTISHLFQGELTKYLSDFMTIRGIAYYELVSGSYALEAEWRYHTPCHVEWRVNYVYSHSKERLSDTLISEGRSHKISLGFEYPLTHSTTIGGEISWEHHQAPAHYNSYGLNLFVRKYW